MSQLTDEMLRQIMPHAPRVSRLESLPHLNAAMSVYSINNERRASAFLATLAVESGELKYNEELALGAAYDRRADLGNTRPRAVALARAAKTTPGRFYKGHGRIQCTGFDVHEAYTEFLQRSGHLPFVDFTKEPHRLAEEPYATDSAAWFFTEFKHLNTLADERQFLEVQIRVNGRNRQTHLPNNWVERRSYYERALKVIPDDFLLDARKVEASADISHPDFETVASEAPRVEQTQVSREDATPVSRDIDAQTSAGVEDDAQDASDAKNAPQPDSEPKKPTPATADIVVAASQPVDAGAKKSLRATVIGVATMAATWLSTNVGEAFGFIKENAIDLNAALKWCIIVAGALIALYILRQIVMSAIKWVSATIFTLHAMKYHADPQSNNVSVGEPAPPPAAS